MPSLNSTLLAAEYYSGKSTPDISAKYMMPLSAVRRALLGAGVIMRSHSLAVSMAGNKISAKLKGIRRGPIPESRREKIRTLALARHAKTALGYTLKPNGYIEFTRGGNVGRSVHRVLMETVLGRKLSFNEVVHHKDGNKRNNNIENLVVMDRAKHTSLHRKQKHAIS